MIARVGSLVTFTCREVVSLLLQTSCRRESYSLGKPKRLLSFATSQELRDPSARVQQRCLFFLSLLLARCGSPQHPSHYDACFSKLHQPHQILLCLCAVFLFFFTTFFVCLFTTFLIVFISQYPVTSSWNRLCLIFSVLSITIRYSVRQTGSIQQKPGGQVCLFNEQTF